MQCKTVQIPIATELYGEDGGRAQHSKILTTLQNRWDPNKDSSRVLQVKGLEIYKYSLNMALHHEKNRVEVGMRRVVAGE